MKMKVLRRVLVTVGLLIFCQSNVVFAADDPIGFNVEPELPATQIDNDQSYFYIKTTPTNTQELTVTVIGTSDEAVKVKAYAVNANTSEEGTVNYQEGTPKDETLTDSIEEIVTIEPAEFEVSKDKAVQVKIHVTPPAESYEGIKLGTIYFSRVMDEAETEAAVSSSYSYRVGLMLSESDQEYLDGKTLNLVDVVPELKRAQKTIQLQFQNPEPKMISGLVMDVEIVEKKNNKVVKKTTLKDGAMAPNSHFNLGVDWGLEPIPSGDYIARVTADSRYEQWELEKEFTISPEVAKKMNEDTLFKLTLPDWGYRVIVGLSVAIVGDFVYLIIRKRKWTQLKKQQRKNKSGKKRGGKK